LHGGEGKPRSPQGSLGKCNSVLHKRRPLQVCMNANGSAAAEGVAGGAVDCNVSATGVATPSLQLAGGPMRCQGNRKTVRPPAPRGVAQITRIPT
ncbi:hypothetical protein CSUI_005408, partial [Cystoisospora suis]